MSISPSAQTWKSLFSDWPAELPRRGVVLSTLNESMPFCDFWLRGDTILLQRKNPDTSGSRYILLSCEGIDSVRFVDPLGDQTIAAAGFTAGAKERSPQPV